MLKFRQPTGRRTSPPAAFALIIGVEEYHSYDRHGGKNLSGARNDAIYWWRQLVLTQQFDPANVTVLTSPVLKRDELGWDTEELKLARKSHLGEATCEKIRKAYGNLVRDVERGSSSNAESDTSQSVGVFAWSGHGSTRLKLKEMLQIPGKGLILCPSDYTRTGENGIPLGELIPTRRGDGTSPQAKGTEELCEFSALTTRRITYFLDACYSTEAGERQEGRGSRSARSRCLQTTSEDREYLPATSLAQAHIAHPPVLLHDFEGRLMLAAHVQNFAHEVYIGGEMRGAWSWAMMTMMDQWRQEPIFPGRRELRPLVRHEDLNHACRELLSLLNIEQGPRYAGLTQMEDMALFQPGEGRPQVALSDRPDGASTGVQLRPDISDVGVYEIRSSAGPVALVYTSPQSGRAGGQTESWYFTGADWVDSDALAIRHQTQKSADDPSRSSFPRQFKDLCPCDPTWNNSAFTASGYTWFLTDDRKYLPTDGTVTAVALGLRKGPTDATITGIAWRVCAPGRWSLEGAVLGFPDPTEPFVTLGKVKEEDLRDYTWWVEYDLSHPSPA